MATQFFKTDSLVLVWLAGNGKVNNTVQSNKKYGKRVKEANVSELCDEVRNAVCPGKRLWTGGIGLKKAAILMKGVCLIHELKIRQLSKMLEACRIKVTHHVIRSQIDDSKRKRGGPEANVITVELNDIAVADCPGDFNFTFNTYSWSDPWNALERHLPGGFHRSISPLMENYGEQISGEAPTTTRTKKRKEAAPKTKKRRTEVSLPSEDAILELLCRESRFLSPLAHTLNEVDLPNNPLIPDAELNEFGPFDESMFRGYVASSAQVVSPPQVQMEEDVECGFDTLIARKPCEDSPPRVRAELQIPQAPRRPNAKETVQANEAKDGSLELRSLEVSEQSVIPVRRGTRRRLKFDLPGETFITNKDMLLQIRDTQMNDEEKSDCVWAMKPDLIKITEQLVQQQGVTLSHELVRDVRRRTCTGLEFIQGSGRLILNRGLQELVKPALSGGTLDLRPSRRRNVEELRQGQTVDDQGTLEQNAPKRAPVSLGEIPNLEELTVKDPAILGSLEPCMDIYLDDQIPSLIPNKPNFDNLEQRSQSPALTENRETFDKLVPPGESRRKAAHMFISLLNLQGNKLILLEQNEPYGTIFIDKIED